MTCKDCIHFDVCTKPYYGETLACDDVNERCVNFKNKADYMAEWIKPPIGVSPHWFVYRKRIEELNETIARYLEHIDKKQHTEELKQEYKAIAKWAKEIERLALLEADLYSTPNERGWDNG